MKINFKKAGIVLIIILQIILWTAIVSFKSPEPTPASYQYVMSVDGSDVYKLYIDGRSYILVTSGSSSMSITAQ